MTEKIGPVKNPLTVIAIFAGVAETAGTAVVPFLGPDVQGLYVWFIMTFPFAIVVFFFITLNFNPKVLYAPSDYQHEENFVDLLSSPSASERTEKLKQEFEEEDSGEVTTDGESTHKEDRHEESNSDAPTSKIRERIASSPRVMGLLAEELVLTKLEKDFGSEVKREAQLSVDGSGFLFDGVVSTGKNDYAVEVKYFSDRVSWRGIQRSLDRIESVFNRMSKSAQNSFRLMLTIVSDGNRDKVENKVKENEDMVYGYSFPVDIVFYDLNDLEEEFGLLG